MIPSRRSDVLAGLVWAVLAGLVALALLRPGVTVPPLVASPVAVAASMLVGVLLLTVVTAPLTGASAPANLGLLVMPAVVLLPVHWTAPVLGLTALAGWRAGRTRKVLYLGAVRGGLAAGCALIALVVTRPLFPAGARPVVDLTAAQTVALFLVGAGMAYLFHLGWWLLLQRHLTSDVSQTLPFVVMSALAAGALVPATLLVAPDPVAVVLGVAAVVASSYGWTRLIQTSQEQRREQTQLLRSTLTSEDDARLMMAGRIHDGPVQTLAAVLLLTDPGTGASDPEIERIRHYVRTAEQELRAISAAAGPGPEIFDLRDSLTAGEDSAFGDGPAQDFSVPDDVPRDLARIAWPILDEAIRNAVKHAGAEHVHTTVVVRDDRSLLAWVHDDGAGFDVKAGAKSGHLGMALMNERARAAGGRVSVMSGAKDGTCVHLHVPGVAPEEEPRETPPWICVFCLDEWRNQFAR